jgi:hypothetical protein
VRHFRAGEGIGGSFETSYFPAQDLTDAGTRVAPNHIAKFLNREIFKQGLRGTGINLEWESSQKLLSWYILVTPTHTDLGQRYDADE